MTSINNKRELIVEYKITDKKDMQCGRIYGYFHYFNGRVHGCDKRYYDGKLFKHLHSKNGIFHGTMNFADFKTCQLLEEVYYNYGERMATTRIEYIDHVNNQTLDRHTLSQIAEAGN